MTKYDPWKLKTSRCLSDDQTGVLPHIGVQVALSISALIADTRLGRLKPFWRSKFDRNAIA
ncbi:MAG: hypothetical protein WBG50_17695 [Desulfomonilaceae bacterium]